MVVGGCSVAIMEGWRWAPKKIKWKHQQKKICRKINILPLFTSQRASLPRPFCFVRITYYSLPRDKGLNNAQLLRNRKLIRLLETPRLLSKYISIIIIITLLLLFTEISCESVTQHKCIKSDIKGSTQSKIYRSYFSHSFLQNAYDAKDICVAFKSALWNVWF